MAVTSIGRPFGRRLGDLLVADGLINRWQLERALEEQKGTREKLGSLLVRLRLLTEEQLSQFLSRQYGVSSITFSQLDIDRDLLKLVPVTMAKKYEIVPIKRTGDTLTLAMSDPTNVLAIDDVAFLTGLQVLPAVAPQSAIRKAIESQYDAQVAALTEIITELEGESDVEVVDAERETAIDTFELRESADEPPMVRLVNMLLVDAIRRGASDIHFEPYEKVFRVRFRIDGVLHEIMTPPKRLEPALDAEAD